MLPLLLALPALSTALALAPIRRPFPLAVAGWVAALLVGPVTVADLVGASLAAAVCTGLAVVLARHLVSGRVLDAALEEAAGLSTTRPARRPRTPWLRVLLEPCPLRPHSVACTDVVYGPDPDVHRAHLYIRRTPGEAGPLRGVFVHLHGGHFRAGGPSREARALLFDHADRGWAAISATYTLAPTPEGGFPAHLVDVKRLLRWIREHGPEHGIPAGAPIVLAGSSAGAHIASMAALTAGDPRFQPGFEGVDTTVAGLVGLYGYYGRLGAATRDVSDPVRHAATAAPPALIIHGTLDAYTPVKGSRRLVRHLRAASPNPVAYAELPGAQHGFDAVATPRLHAVVRSVARFTDALA